MMLGLLRSLGYDAHPVLARIGPPGPDQWLGRHQAILVTLGDDRYLVDAGNGIRRFLGNRGAIGVGIGGLVHCIGRCSKAGVSNQTLNV